MKIVNAEKYRKLKQANQNFYCSCIFGYAERVADLAEKKIRRGHSVLKAVKDSMNSADTLGINQRMRKEAIGVLKKFWIYGRHLQKEIKKEGSEWI